MACSSGFLRHHLKPKPGKMTASHGATRSSHKWPSKTRVHRRLYMPEPWLVWLRWDGKESSLKYSSTIERKLISRSGNNLPHFLWHFSFKIPPVLENVAYTPSGGINYIRNTFMAFQKPVKINQTYDIT